MEPINLFLSQQDAKQVNKIFDECDDPQFTIISESKFSDDMVCMNICFQSSITFWYLAQRVHMYNEHDRKIRELEENLYNKLNKK